MGKALETVFSEITLRDAASRGLDKIAATSKKAAAAIMGVETGLRKINMASENVDKAFSKGGKFEGFGALNAKAQNMAQSVGSGSAFHNAISQVHFIGPYVGAALTAMHSTAQLYVQGMQQQQQDTLLSGSYARAFRATNKREMAELQKLDKSRSSAFRQKDFRAAMTGLREMGVSQEVLTRRSDALQLFTKSQGHGTLSEGVGALLGGQVKHGGAFDNETVQVLKQVAAQAGTSGMSADMVIDLLGQIIEDNKKRLGKDAEAMKAFTSTSATLSNIATSQEALRTRPLGTKGIGKAYNSSMFAQGLEQDLQVYAGSGAGAAIQKVRQVFQKENVGKPGGGGGGGAELSAGGGGGGASGGPAEGTPPSARPVSSSTTSPANVILNVYGSGQDVVDKIRQEMIRLFQYDARVSAGLEVAG